VRYFEKSRMEISDPAGDPSSPWYVTNGLLVVELVTGQMQIGLSSFHSRQPPEVNVAGDPDDADGPTYATFGGLRALTALTYDAGGKLAARRQQRRRRSKLKRDGNGHRRRRDGVPRLSTGQPLDAVRRARSGAPRQARRCRCRRRA
jgi:YD repeat-containing protein